MCASTILTPLQRWDESYLALLISPLTEQQVMDTMEPLQLQCKNTDTGLFLLQTTLFFGLSQKTMNGEKAVAEKSFLSFQTPICNIGS